VNPKIEATPPQAKRPDQYFHENGGRTGAQDGRNLTGAVLDQGLVLQQPREGCNRGPAFEGQQHLLDQGGPAEAAPHDVDPVQHHRGEDPGHHSGIDHGSQQPDDRHEHDGQEQVLDPGRRRGGGRGRRPQNGHCSGRERAVEHVQGGGHPDAARRPSPLLPPGCNGRRRQHCKERGVQRQAAHRVPQVLHDVGPEAARDPEQAAGQGGSGLVPQLRAPDGRIFTVQNARDRRFLRLADLRQDLVAAGEFGRQASLQPEDIILHRFKLRSRGLDRGQRRGHLVEDGLRGLLRPARPERLGPDLSRARQGLVSGAQVDGPLSQERQPGAHLQVSVLPGHLLHLDRRQRRLLPERD
jgi:hypothetical protein